MASFPETLEIKIHVAGVEKPTKQIYLAGGFYQDRKSFVAHELKDSFLIYDPEKADEFHHIPGIYVGRDLGAIRASQILIAYHDSYDRVLGMAAEVGYAAALNIPVIYICTNVRADSFLTGLARATFTNLYPACAFIKERYL